MSVNATTQAATVRRRQPFGEQRGAMVTWPNEKGFVGGTNDPTGLEKVGARTDEQYYGKSGAANMDRPFDQAQWDRDAQAELDRQKRAKEAQQKAYCKAHWAARRHLAARYQELRGEYGRLPNGGRAADGYEATIEAKRIFPRYRAVEAILVDVERLDPDRLPGAGVVAEELLEAAEHAQSPFVEPPSAEVEAQAAADERRLFAGVVRDWTARAEIRVDPLPYRRVLPPEESADWRAKLVRRWGVRDFSWHPGWRVSGSTNTRTGSRTRRTRRPWRSAARSRPGSPRRGPRSRAGGGPAGPSTGSDQRIRPRGCV
ncbi:hypothetical protein [Dactylosporangium sp. CS-033363]|uniref:hypothetical protein n=1 Tax=Dactylosporangium sp. CS-033363 TaxID=3239935 RepID=UPI003D92FFF7